MPRSVEPPLQSSRVDALDSLCLKPAKADLRVNADQVPLRTVVSQAIRNVTSQKAAALDMAIDQGQLSRQLQTGALTIERLEVLGPAFAAEFGRCLVERFGEAAKSPRERARQRLPELLRELLELCA